MSTSWKESVYIVSEDLYVHLGSSLESLHDTSSFQWQWWWDFNPILNTVGYLAHDLFNVDFHQLSSPCCCMQALQRALLSCMYTTLDYAQTGLIAAVFFFKVSSPILVLVSNYQKRHISALMENQNINVCWNILCALFNDLLPYVCFFSFNMYPTFVSCTCLIEW